MKGWLTFFFVLFVSSLASGLGSPAEEAAGRAKEFAEAWATKRFDSEWEKSVLPEYWHPRGNDSGLPSRHPSFLPKVDLTRGTFLITNLKVGSVIGGKSPWVLQGSDFIYCVEIIYTVVAMVADRATVAPVEDRVSILQKQQVRSAFYAMCLDKKDHKWKFVQMYPYMAYFYEIPYFLKSWEKILGEGSVKNIPEVRQRLLDFVKK